MTSTVRRIGRATLYRGDAMEIMGGLERSHFAAVIADPPYSSGAGRDKSAPPSAKYQSSEHRGLYPEFLGDARDQRSYLAWSAMWLRAARAATRPGGIAVMFSDWRQLPVTTDALQAADWIWRGINVWDKTERTRPQLGRYRNQAEYAAWATNGARPLAGAVAPGVFRVAVDRVKHHMTGKPVELMDELLRLVDGPVLDPFMGSAPVGLAALARGLDYVGIEASEEYFEIACRRLEAALVAA